MKWAELIEGVESVAKAAADFQRRLDDLVDHRPPSPLIRGALLTSAAALADAVRAVTPFRQPRELIAEEWRTFEFMRLRQAIETAGHAAAQRPHAWSEWTNENRLTTAELLDAWAKFDRVLER